jgi:hypothetical protein
MAASTTGLAVALIRALYREILPLPKNHAPSVQRSPTTLSSPARVPRKVAGPSPTARMLKSSLDKSTAASPLKTRTERPSGDRRRRHPSDSLEISHSPPD